MKTYKYLTDTVVAVFDEDGISRTSGLSSALVPEGATIEPADPVPNPRIEQIKQELALIDTKSIRSIREGDTVRMAQWEAQATELRSELSALLA